MCRGQVRGQCGGQTPAEPMPAQGPEGALGGRFTRRIEHRPDQCDQFAPDVALHRGGRRLGQAPPRFGRAGGQFPTQLAPQVEDAALVEHPTEPRAQVSGEARGPVAGHAPHIGDRQARHLRPPEEPLPLARCFFAGRHHRRPDHPAHTIHEQQDHPRGPAPQPRPQTVGEQLSARRHPRELPPHGLPRLLARRIEPPLHRARAQRAARGRRGGRVQGPPELPPLLLAQPRAEQFRRAAHRGPDMLPVVERAATHLPRVPTAPHQQRRLFRVRPPARRTPVALHPHPPPSGQEPRVPRVAAPAAGPPRAAMGTLTPIPGPPGRQLAQPLEEHLAPFNNVHGHCHHGRFSTFYGGRCPLPPPGPHQHDLGTES